MVESNPLPVCRNCEEPLSGEFCSHCGQRVQGVGIPFRALVGDFLTDELQVDSRLSNTLRALFLQPGALTADFLAGRRARHLPPLRLYLMSSVVFLLLLSVAQGTLTITNTSDDGTGADSVTLVTGASGDTVDSVAGGGVPEPGTATPDSAGVEESASKGVRTRVLTRLQSGIATMAADPVLAQRLWAKAWGWVMFLNVPIFALLLWIFFRGATHYYAEHLIFALHFHAFAFLTFSALMLVQRVVGVAVGLVLGLATLLTVLVYLGAALKRVHGQGHIRTMVKTLVVTAIHAFVLAVSAGVAILLALFMATR